MGVWLFNICHIYVFMLVVLKVETAFWDFETEQNLVFRMFVTDIVKVNREWT